MNLGDDGSSCRQSVGRDEYMPVVGVLRKSCTLSTSIRP